MDYCMIEVAFDDKEQAQDAISKLLNKRLIASAQVVESNSYWNWQYKFEESKEYLVFLKTRRIYAKEIYDVIKKIHTYDVFEFAMMDITSYSNEYLSWIDSETRKFNGKE